MVGVLAGTDLARWPAPSQEHGTEVFRLLEQEASLRLVEEQGRDEDHQRIYATRASLGSSSRAGTPQRCLSESSEHPRTAGTVSAETGPSRDVAEKPVSVYATGVSP